MNRKKGYSVKSYGTGSVVKLPGPAPDQPNVFPFGTTYEHMYQELYRKDPHLYPSYSPVDVAMLSEQWYMIDWVKNVLKHHTKRVLFQLFCFIFVQYCELYKVGLFLGGVMKGKV